MTGPKLNRFFFNDSILEIGTGSGGIASYFAHKRDIQFHITVLMLLIVGH